MIRPRYNRLYAAFWSWYFAGIIRSDFDSFSYNRDVHIDRERGLLVLANHFSWWDGFFIYHLNNLFFKKRFHVMMLEQELSKRLFLTYAGAFSINKNSRSLIESLRFAGELLQDPQNMVLIFPQGRIESQYTVSPTFEKGLMRILEQGPQKIQVLFSVALTDYLEKRKPALHLYLKNYDGPFEFNVLRDAFLEHYQASKAKQATLIC